MNNRVLTIVSTASYQLFQYVTFIAIWIFKVEEAVRRGRLDIVRPQDRLDKSRLFSGDYAAASE